MAHILALLLAFPCVVFTVPLAVTLLYWVTVLAGAAHIDLLGGAEGGHDAAFDGGADGADAGADGGDAGADGGHDADGDGDGDEGHDGEGQSGGLIAALKLRSAPATVVLSLFFFFSWILSVAGVEIATATMPALLGVLKVVFFFLAPAVALPLTSLAVRPISKLFVTPEATASVSLVGKVCTIRTGSVTAKFGEATLDDGGAGLVVRVRIDDGDTTTKLKRGDQAVIVAYDDERQEFTVAPMKMSELLAERTAERVAEAPAEPLEDATADAENVGKSASQK